MGESLLLGWRWGLAPLPIFAILLFTPQIAENDALGPGGHRPERVNNW